MLKTLLLCCAVIGFLFISQLTLANEHIPSVKTITTKPSSAIIKKGSSSKEAYITLIVYKAGYKSKPDNDSTNVENDRVRKKAKWAKFLGIGSLVGLLLPVVGVLSLPAAIVAIITGNQAKKDAPDKKSFQDAKTGVITGWVTIGLFALAVILVIIIIAAFANWWN